MMQVLNKIADQFGQCSQVIAVVLAGSHGRGKALADSDFDVYVYLKGPFDVEVRKRILEPYVSYMEYDNRFWETEDDGTLTSGQDIELIYRVWDDFVPMVEGIVLEGQPWNSYTTCFWNNILHSQILFDGEGEFARLQKKLQIPYPENLRRNLILRSTQLLKDKMPSLFFQLEKAVKRQDLVSINHRTAELLAVFFDILFALNRQSHPGEKRLLEEAEFLPLKPWTSSGMWKEFFSYLYTDGPKALLLLKDTLELLRDLLRKEGFPVSWDTYQPR